MGEHLGDNDAKGEAEVGGRLIVLVGGLATALEDLTEAADLFDVRKTGVNAVERVSVKQVGCLNLKSGRTQSIGEGSDPGRQALRMVKHEYISHLAPPS